jgi:signal transduction histidine kinase
LLRIAQVESGTKKSNFADVDITKIFVDVVELYEPLASVNGLSLEITQADPCHIQGDKDLLFQMLVNLMDNAIKYTPEGGSIATALIVDNQHLTIVFADNGPGIPIEKYSKVFQRFYRVEESRGVQPGNGLGLSLVQAVAVLHGGNVSLSDSKAYYPDSATQGLQVRVTMPLDVKV